MSLISIRNFMAPFTNTTNLVTIILITVVFALFRIQGGGFTVRSTDLNTPEGRVLSEPKSSASGSRMGATPDELDSLGILPPKRPAAAVKQQLPEAGTIEISPEEGDLLGQMMEKRDDRPAGQRPADQPQGRPKSRTGNSLDEIERSLGIR